jgi:PEGA domain
VLSVSSDVAADVWLDGEPVGRTPTGNVPAAIGEHEVLITHSKWGEQRVTVIVGLGAPTRLNVKLVGATGSKPGAQRASPKRSGISAAR